METTSFLIWAAFIGAIGAFAIGAMLRAYVGKGSLAVVFPEPIAQSPDQSLATLNPDAAAQFQQGYAAFRRYRTASDRFAAAIQQDPTFAEAYHCRGRAIANLRRDNEAVALLVRAGELYLEQENKAGYEQVKQDLQTLKENRNK